MTPIILDPDPEAGPLYRRQFSGYTPSVRAAADGPWTGVKIYEGVTVDTFALLDDQALDPVDDNPEAPDTRSFTVDNATLPVGWYVLEFYDGTGVVEQTDPVYYGGILTPSVQQVADFLRARTISMGQQLNRFDSTTDPTADQVEGYTQQAATDLVAEVGRAIPLGARDLFRAVAKIGAAMLIEVNSEDINEARYDRLSTSYDKKLEALREAIKEVEAGGDPGDVDDVYKPLMLGNSMTYNSKHNDSTWDDVD